MIDELKINRNIHEENMKDIKLIAIDIDGTLLNSERKLTPGVISTIKQASAVGKKVVICTGRPLAGAREYLEPLGLDEQDDQYIISFGGALVETTTGHGLIEETLSYDDYIRIEALARKTNLHFHASSDDCVYTANRNIGKYTVHESVLCSIGIKYRTQEEMADKKIYKCMYVDDPDVLSVAMAKYQADFAQLAKEYMVVKSTPFYLEVNRKGVNKGTALKALTEKLGLTQDNVMAIGDEANDLSMIEYAETGVAMGNGTDLVKKTADVVTADNDHDGVAQAIKNIL